MAGEQIFPLLGRATRHTNSRSPSLLAVDQYAALSEAAITEVRADGNKDAEANVSNPLAVPMGKVELKELENGSDASIHQVEYPTEDERHTLRRIPEAIPVMAFWVAFCELAERFSYYGCTQVFQNFLQRPRPDYAVGGYTGANTSAEGNPGALGLGQRTATALSTFNSFWVYVTPLIGAYLADAHFGRFKTICIAVAIATFGHILLIIPSIPQVMNDPNGALAAFVIAIVIMGIGTGFFKSNVAPLIAEQIANRKQVVRVTKSGERVILDPSLTTARLFMYFYAAINIGASECIPSSEHCLTPTDTIHSSSRWSNRHELLGEEGGLLPCFCAADRCLYPLHPGPLLWPQPLR